MLTVCQLEADCHHKCYGSLYREMCLMGHRVTPSATHSLIGQGVTARPMALKNTERTAESESQCVSHSRA